MLIYGTNLFTKSIFKAEKNKKKKQTTKLSLQNSFFFLVRAKERVSLFQFEKQQQHQKHFDTLNSQASERRS